MLAKYKAPTNGFIAVGLLFQIMAIFLSETPLGGVIRVVGGVLVIVGCCFYAKGKGHSAALGLLGILSIIGLLILICLKDRTVTCAPSSVTFRCPSCSGGMVYSGVLRAGQKMQCPHCGTTFVIHAQQLVLEAY